MTTSTLNRRGALMGVLGIMLRGWGGSTPVEANLTIPLHLYPRIRIVFGDETVWVSGKEIFNVLKSTLPVRGDQ